MILFEPEPMNFCKTECIKCLFAFVCETSIPAYLRSTAVTRKDTHHSRHRNWPWPDPGPGFPLPSLEVIRPDGVFYKEVDAAELFSLIDQIEVVLSDLDKFDFESESL